MYALVAIIIFAAVGIGINVAYSYVNHQSDQSNKRVIVHIDNNGGLSIAQARRTECRAVRSAALDKARWGLVFDLLAKENATPDDLASAAAAGKALPSIDTLTNKGGRVGNVVFAACPPSIAKRSS